MVQKAPKSSCFFDKWELAPFLFYKFYKFRDNFTLIIK